MQSLLGSVQDKDKWSANADSYAKGNLHFAGASVESMLREMDKVAPFERAKAVLDVGGGPGVTLGRLIAGFGSKLPPSTRLIASDFSSGMIDKVLERQKAEQEKGENTIWARVEAKVLDAHTLEGIEDASISHVTGTMVYNLLSNSRQALEAAHRVLGPGGVIGMTLGAGAEWMELMRQAAKKIRGEGAPTYHFPATFSTPEGIRSEFDAVGLTTEHIELADHFMDVTDPKPLVDTFIRGQNPGAMFFVGDYTEELDRFVKEFLRLILEKCPKTPRKLKGRMIVAVGKKSL